MRYRFDSFEFDVERGLLQRDGVELMLRPQLFALLALLIENRDRVVSQAEMREAIWSSTHVSDATLRGVIRDLRAALGDASARGRIIRTVPRRGYRFVAPIDSDRRGLSPAPDAFVGRRALLAAAAGWVESARAGRGAVAFLSGEAGIGKTRAALEIAELAKAQGFASHWGRCLEEDGAPPYWPWRQLMSSCLEGGGVGRAGELTQWLDLNATADEANAMEATGASRFRLYEAFADVLREAARTQPRLLVIDDLHRADSSSLALLAHLMGEFVDVPVVLLVLYREEEAAADPLLQNALGRVAPSREQIVLGGLPAEEVVQLVQSLTGHETSGKLRDVIVDRTAGNPFFVTELVRALDHAGALERPDAPHQAASLSPRGALGLIRHRISKLQGPASSVLETAAVFGREFSLDLLERACLDVTPARVREVVDAAAAAGLISAIEGLPGRMRFAHILVRDAVYADLSPTRSALLHAAVGLAIEGGRAGNLEPYFAELSHHFEHAIPIGEAERAHHYARKAAHQSLAQVAYDEAAEWFEAACTTLESLQGEPSELGRERAELLVLAGRALWAAGRTNDARERFSEAFEVASRSGAIGLQARAALGFAGRTDVTPGVNDRAVVMLETVLDKLPESKQALTSEVAARLGTELYRSPDSEPSDRHTQRALDVAEALGDANVLGYALTARVFVLNRPDVEPRVRLRLLERLDQLSGELGTSDVVALGLQQEVLAHLEVGDLVRFDAALSRFRQFADELGQPFFRWMVSSYTTMRAMYAGDLERVPRLAEETFALGAAINTPNAAPIYAAHVFLLRWLRGQLADLAPQLKTQIDATPAYPAIRIGLAITLFEAGMSEPARDILTDMSRDDFAALPQDHDWLGTMHVLSLLCVSVGNEYIASRIYDRLRPHSGRLTSLGHGAVCMGAVDHCLGLLARHCGAMDQAQDHFDGAIGLLRRTGGKLHLAHAQTDLSSLLLKYGNPGDRERARELLAEASKAFEGAGLDHRVSQVQEIARL